MKYEEAFDMMCSMFGKPFASGCECRVWLPSSRYVVKLSVLNPANYRLHRSIMRWPASAPIARILDIRVVGTRVTLFGHRVIYCIIIQERKFMRLIDDYRLGGMNIPPDVFHVDGQPWRQKDCHDGNYAEGVWIDFGCLCIVKAGYGKYNRKHYFDVVPVGA